MKKGLTKFLAIALTAITAFSASACVSNNQGGGGNGSTSELLVYGYAGGVGNVWLDKVIDRFETAFADYSFEPGKVGVTVETNKTKVGADLGTIQSAPEDVFFSEWVDIPAVITTDKTLNIHDVVTTPLNTFLEGRTTDTQTIEDKLYPESQAFFSFRNDTYYGLPHYSHSPTLTYNRQLFEDKGFYFAKDPVGTSLKGKFISNTNTVKSCGPDGVLGNEDDGLPATWDEMFVLFDYISKTDGCKPITFAGKSAYGYTKYLLTNAYLNLVGKDVASYNYSFDSAGKTINIVTGWESTQATALPTKGTATVTPSDSSALNKQLERYQALAILDKILDTEAWLGASATDSEAGMLEAQKEFVDSYNKGENPVAILMEGSYWYNEAKDARYFEEAEYNYGEEFEAMNDYQVMPVPRNYTGTAKNIEGVPQRKTVVADQSDSFACINASIADDANRVKLAKMFLAFCYTQESLAEFTETTDTVRYLKYTVDESKLSDYGKSLYTYTKNSDILLPYSDHILYTGNKINHSLHIDADFWEHGAGTPYDNLDGKTKHVKKYFEGYMKRSV